MMVKLSVLSFEFLLLKRIKKCLRLPPAPQKREGGRGVERKKEVEILS